jgi:hypothetical protein
MVRTAWRATLPAITAALAMTGCLEAPPPGPVIAPEIEFFGKADTLIYIGDTARFEVTHAPRSAEVTGYAWTFSRNEGRGPVRWDSVETVEPFLERVFRPEQAGYHDIQVKLLGVEQAWLDYFGFRVRVDLGRPKLSLETARELPFGPGNRIQVKASDPDGRIVRYHWSTVYGTFTDSSDIPEWALPDSLIEGQSIYCRVRDEDGQVSDTLSQFIRFRSKGTYGWVRDGLTGISALAGGGFLVAGTTQSFDSRHGDAWLARIDADGMLLAQATVKRSHAFGAVGTGRFNALAGGSGTYLAVGAYRDSTHDDGLFALVNAEGKVLAQGFAEGKGNQEFVAAAALESGSWLAVGRSSTSLPAPDTTSGLLGFISPAGSLQSTSLLTRGRSLQFYCATATDDGNALVGGTGFLDSRTSSGFLYKISPTGDSLWLRPADPGGFTWVHPRALIACRAGGFALLAIGNDGAFVQRLDGEGRTQWTRILYTLQGEPARAGSLAETPDGDFLAGLDLPYKAQPYSGVQLTRLDALGAVKWTRRLGRYEDDIQAVAAVPGGGFAAAGTLSRSDDMGVTTPLSWILRLADDGKVMW